ncbi:hypothetical protein CGRA01v4_07062 [Colletotrichum graminicola]|nr:hypothetical protein CGRA01v4_07062 [Colletotrichum graminicola]
MGLQLCDSYWNAGQTGLVCMSSLHGAEGVYAGGKKSSKKEKRNDMTRKGVTASRCSTTRDITGKPGKQARKVESDRTVRCPLPGRVTAADSSMSRIIIGNRRGRRS